MKKRILASFVLLALASALLPAQNTVAQDKWLGTWKLNLAKSKSQGGPLPKSSTLDFDESSEGVKVTNDWVNSVDIPAHTEFTAKYDGNFVTIEGLPPGSMVALTRIDPYKLDMIQKSANGVTLTARYVVSRDLKTLTVTQTMTNVDGLKLTNVLVFETGGER